MTSVHRFPDGFEVMAEESGRIDWNATVAQFGLPHADRLLDRTDVVWSGGHPGNFGHDEPFVAS